jgi:hypothetical protein
MANPLLDEPIRVRLTNPADMAAAVPHLVGFYPTESLVVISLRGPRKRVGLTMRFDLPAVQHHAPLADDVALRLATDGAERALIACCTSQPDHSAGLPRCDLVAAISERLDARDIALMDALLLRDGRWWSYLCDDPACCPSGGTPVTAATDVAAAHALVGRALLPDRAALADTLRPVQSLAREAMSQALDRVGDSVADRVAAGEVAAVRAETVALVAELAERYADPADAWMTDDEAARVIIGLFDIHGRDKVLTTAIGADLTIMQSVMVEICRRAIPPADAPPCAVLAWLAYAHGHGALANVALDRALASDPDYSLAHLLRDALFQQVPPAVLRETWLLASKRTSPRKSTRR